MLSGDKPLILTRTTAPTLNGRGGLNGAGCALLLGLVMGFNLLTAASVQTGPSPWELVENRPTRLSALLRFQDAAQHQVAMDWFFQGKGVLQPVVDRGVEEGALFWAHTLVARGDVIPRALTVTADRGSGKHPLRLVFDFPEHYRCFALAGRNPQGSLVTVRKHVQCHDQGVSRCFLGGVPVMPDKVNRPGVMGLTEVPDGTLGESRVDRSTAFLPAMAVCRGRRFAAWHGPTPGLGQGIWLAREDGRPRLLTPTGAFPQLVSFGDSLYCIWRRENDIFMMASRNGGDTWDGERRIAGDAALTGLSAAVHGSRLLVVWASDYGVGLRCFSTTHAAQAAPKAIFSVSHQLKGQYKAPRAVVFPDGRFAVACLRRSARGREAVGFFFSPAGQQTGPAKVLLDTSDVREVVLAHMDRTLHCAFLVNTPEGVRIAHWIHANGVYLLPPVDGKPLLAGLGPWGRGLGLHYAVFRHGRFEMETFTSRDGGFTWSGPLRLFSGRSFCPVRSDMVIRWSQVSAGGDVTVNGETLFTIPEAVPCGQAVLGMPLPLCAPQGWVRDEAVFSGRGRVSVTALFQMPPMEAPSFGLNQAHAEEIAGALTTVGASGPDLVLTAESVKAGQWVGRAKHEFSMTLGLCNVGAIGASASTVSVSLADAGKDQVLLTKQVAPVDRKTEQQLLLKFLLPAAPGLYTIQCRVDAPDDQDVTNNVLTFPLHVVPDQELVLIPGRTQTVILPEQKRIILKTRQPAFLLATQLDEPAGSEPGIGLAALLTGEEGNVECRLDRPVSVPPGEFVLMLRPEGRKARYTIGLHKKNDPYEPNDRVTLAPVLTPGVTLNLTLMPAGDRDYFVFSLSEPGHLFFQSPAEPGEVAVSLRPRGKPWLFTKRMLPVSACLAPAVYEVCVSERWDRSITEPFALKVDFAAAQDSFEPNDRLGQATAFPCGETRRLTLFPPGDRDWLRCDIAKRGYLYIQAKQDGAGPAVSCGLHDAAGGPLTPVKTLPAGFKVSQGPVYACLETAGVPGRRELAVTVDFREEFDTLEPNDTREAAHPLAMPGDAFIALWPPGDQDWFACNCEAGYIRISLPKGAPKSVKPVASLWQGRACTYQAVPLPALFRVDAGRVWLNIHGTESPLPDASAAEKLFPLRFHFEPEKDPAEPNNQPADAARLACPGQAPFMLWPPDDVDYFLLDHGTSGFLTLSVTEAGAPAAVEFLFPQATGQDRFQVGDQAVVRIADAPVMVCIRPCALAGGPVSEAKDAGGQASPRMRILKTAIHTIQDPGEPDGGFDRARAWAEGAWALSSLYPVGDKDYYRMSVKTPGRYRLESGQVPAGLMVCAELFDKEKKKRQVGIRPGAVITLPKGVCYFMVYAFGQQGDRRLFRLRLVKVP